MTEPVELPDATPAERPRKMVKIGDREVLCQGLTETQYMQLVHESRMFSSNVVQHDRKTKGIDRLFRVMLSLVVEQTDKDYVEDLMADGDLDITYLTNVIRDLYGVKEKAPTTGPQVRRGSRSTKR